MSNLILTTYEDKHNVQTFIHVDKNLGQIRPGEKYIFAEFDPHAPNKQGALIGRRLCVHLELKRLDDLTPSIAFLDKNCELDTYREILIKIRKVRPNDMLVVATFSNESNTKEYWKNAPIHN